MDIELTKDEEELILFLSVNGSSFIEDILEKCMHVSKINTVLADLINKDFVEPYLRNRDICGFHIDMAYALTSKGIEAIEWM